MSSRSGWYLILGKTDTVLLIQHNSNNIQREYFYSSTCIYRERSVLLRKGKKIPQQPLSFQQLSQSSTQDSKACSAVSGKDQAVTPAVKPQCPFFTLTKLLFQGQDSPLNMRASASTDCHRKKVQMAWKSTKARTCLNSCSHSSLFSQKPT